MEDYETIYQRKRFNYEYKDIYDDDLEFWKDIKEYEGLYQISSFGLVKSLSRIIKWGKGEMISKERILKNTLRYSGGYYRVELYSNCKPKTIDIHILVAIHFLGHTPCGHNLVIDHIDRNKLNNNVSNLRIVSMRENNSNHDKSKTSSRFVGVNLDKKKNNWMARIYIDGKSKYLGNFENEIDAHLAYEKALKSLNDV